MKHLRNLLFFTAWLLAVAVSQAQSISVVYDFKSKTSTPCTAIAEYRLADDLFGQKWLDLDAILLGGASTGPNRPTLGSVLGAIAIQPRLGDDRLHAQIGIAGRMDAGRPVATGLLLGLRWRF